jgi:hypothetical protein
VSPLSAISVWSGLNASDVAMLLEAKPALASCDQS